MNDQPLDVYPDTIEKIHSARSLSGRPLEDRLVPYKNIGAVLRERADSQGDQVWLTFYGDEGKSAEYTYAEFYDLSRRVGALMESELGLKAGDRLATLMTNDARTVMIYFGAWLIGATVVPINCSEDDER